MVQCCNNAPKDAFKLILVSLAGWMNRQQQHVIEYLLAFSLLLHAEVEPPIHSNAGNVEGLRSCKTINYRNHLVLGCIS